MVEVLVDKVDGAADDLGSEVKRLGLGVEAGKAGQQAGVDVEDAIGKCGHEGRREQAHVAGEADEIHLRLVEALDEVEIALGWSASSDGDVVGGDAKGMRCGEAGGVGLIGEDNGNLCVGNAAVGDCLVDGEEVGAAPGEQDTEAGNVRRGAHTFDCGIGEGWAAIRQVRAPDE